MNDCPICFFMLKCVNGQPATTSKKKNGERFPLLGYECKSNKTKQTKKHNKKLTGSHSRTRITPRAVPRANASRFNDHPAISYRRRWRGSPALAVNDRSQTIARPSDWSLNQARSPVIGKQTHTYQHSKS